jgi:hypothetical protein
LLNEDRTPPALAAACLTDADSTLDEALSWAARLGLDTGSAFRLTGTLENGAG